MTRTMHNLKVLNSVVELILVFMMHNLILVQVSTKMLFHKPPMITDLSAPVRKSHPQVAVVSVKVRFGCPFIGSFANVAALALAVLSRAFWAFIHVQHNTIRAT